MARGLVAVAGDSFSQSVREYLTVSQDGIDKETGVEPSGGITNTR